MGSDHHRYGEVKTRLTIDGGGESAISCWIVPETIFEAAMPAKVTRNARMTVPKRVRDYLGIEPGTEIAFRRAADGRIVIERADRTRPPSRLSRVVGSAGPGPSADAITEMLRGGAALVRIPFIFDHFEITLKKIFLPFRVTSTVY
jgi:antitoxin PrlF